MMKDHEQNSVMLKGEFGRFEYFEMSAIRKWVYMNKRNTSTAYVVKGESIKINIHIDMHTPQRVLPLMPPSLLVF